MIHSNDKIIKASFRGNPPEERKLFSNSSCLMPISVGQSIHEGEKFAAVINLVNSSFKKCTILVDDSVQRHTLAIDRTEQPQDLYNEAVKLGEEWIIRNQEAYSKLTIPYQIIRWDDWRIHPGFVTQLDHVNKLYKNSQAYKDAIHTNIDEFLTRFLGRKETHQIDPNRAFQLCLDYLLEECAVMCLWTHGSYDFELYPSGRNQAMGATYEMLIKPEYPNGIRPVAVRFKKYPKQNILQASPTINEEIIVDLI